MFSPMADVTPTNSPADSDVSELQPAGSQNAKKEKLPPPDQPRYDLSSLLRDEWRSRRIAFSLI